MKKVKSIEYLKIAALIMFAVMIITATISFISSSEKKNLAAVATDPLSGGQVAITILNPPGQNMTVNNTGAN
jgi:hypothetical protein